MEGYRRSLTILDGYRLGIGAGAGVLAVDGAVAVSQLLDIHRSRSQTGNRDFTGAVCRMWPGKKAGAAAVAVDTKLPAGQVLSILRGFLNGQFSRCRSLQLELGRQVGT